MKGGLKKKEENESDNNDDVGFSASSYPDAESFNPISIRQVTQPIPIPIPKHKIIQSVEPIKPIQNQQDTKEFEVSSPEQKNSGMINRPPPLTRRRSKIYSVFGKSGLRISGNEDE